MSTNYYRNINHELLEICPPAKSVIEYGCGEGRFLEAYKSKNPKARVVGFELFSAAAEIAKTRVDEVVVGNAEELDLNDTSISDTDFDLIIYGDVLEHFVDPWKAIKRHTQLLKPGGYICACIPNVSHWSMIFELVNGTFEYKDSGLMDRTHLRFFTKSSIEKMMQDVGLEIEILAPRNFQTKNTENALKTLAKLFGKPMDKIASRRLEDWSTFQYLVRARLPE